MRKIILAMASLFQTMHSMDSNKDDYLHNILDIDCFNNSGLINTKPAICNKIKSLNHNLPAYTHEAGTSMGNAKTVHMSQIRTEDYNTDSINHLPPIAYVDLPKILYDDIYEHMQTHGNQVTVHMKCDQCQMQFKSPNIRETKEYHYNQTGHTSFSIINNNLQCCCKQKKESIQHLVQHMYDKQHFICLACNYNILTSIISSVNITAQPVKVSYEQIQSHLNTHKNYFLIQMECLECNTISKKFKQSAWFTGLHKRKTGHTQIVIKNNPIACAVCMKSFANIPTLIRHMENDNHLTCPCCKQTISI